MQRLEEGGWVVKDLQGAALELLVWSCVSSHEAPVLLAW